MSENQDSSKDKQGKEPASDKVKQKPQPPKNVNLRESDEGNSVEKRNKDD